MGEAATPRAAERRHHPNRDRRGCKVPGARPVGRVEPGVRGRRREGHVMLESLRRFKAGIFRALGHPTRVGVVEYLQYGEQSVERLCEKLRCDEATLGPHLAALTKAA